MIPIIVGHKEIFALHCEVDTFYESDSLRALGKFLIWVNGCQYGVDEFDASMLGCSRDGVVDRLSNRGSHVAAFAQVPAAALADAFWLAYDTSGAKFCLEGVSIDEFRGVSILHNLIWIPDGDAAFDDGSWIIQFDICDKVRLVAFKGQRPAEMWDLNELTIESNTYYSILQDWLNKFDQLRACDLANSSRASE